MRDHDGDIAALQAGLHLRRPARNGLRLYTTDFDSVCLCDFYRGRQAFLVLSGPSLADHDLSMLDRRGIVTMGVNNSWAVHRPTLWTCVDNPGRFIDTGWKDPGILKFVPMANWNARLRIQKPGGRMAPSAFRVRQMPSVLLYRRSEHFDHRRFLDEDTVCWGNNSATKDSLGIKGKRSVMMVALRLLHYLGFRVVYLIGADFKMADDRRYAFDEARSSAAIRHNNLLYEALNRRFEAMRDYFKRSRFTVWNCTPGSGLTAFAHMPYERAVEKAGAECGKPVDTKGWYS
ncbi:MAG: hypothetical protein D6685_17945 [Bacteroidetes bacterium]|nr:MAG: hypothetical protein D6685_17945 [Bacteroidota bacterium]